MNVCITNCLYLSFPVYLQAYCLYRQNKLHEALETLKGEERSAPVLQLESQILYRLGKMEACMESYEKLQMSKTDSFSLELKTNFIAALIDHFPE